MLNTAYATEVVTDGPVQPGTIAHRRFLGKDAKGVEYGGTERRPACLPQPVDADGYAAPEPERWNQYGAGRAEQLGAVACTAAECFGGAA